MINDENVKLYKKIESFNCERCDQKMLEKRSNDWQDPDHSDGEKIKMCNSYYGLIGVKDEKETTEN